MGSPGELPGSANLARYFQTPSTLPPLQPLLPLSQLRICCADNKTTSSLGLAMQKRRPTRALKLESYDRAQQSSSPRPNNSFSSDVDCTEEFMLATPGSCAGRETRAVKKKSRHCTCIAGLTAKKCHIAFSGQHLARKNTDSYTLFAAQKPSVRAAATA